MTKAPRVTLKKAGCHYVNIYRRKKYKISICDDCMTIAVDRGEYGLYYKTTFGSTMWPKVEASRGE